MTIRKVLELKASVQLLTVSDERFELLTI